MLKTAFTVLSLIGFLLTASSAQEPSWADIRSDDGRMAFQMPVTLRHFYDADGFIISSQGGDIEASAFHILNAYYDNAIVSLEGFKGSPSGLERLYDSDRGRRDVTGTSKAKVSGIEIREITYKTNAFVSERRYFRVGEVNYIVTAASRDPDSAFTKKFLESFRFAAKDESVFSAGVPLMNVKRHEISVEVKGQLDDDKSNSAAGPKKNAEEGVVKLAVVHKPFASYTGAARQKGTAGTIQLRVTFANEGLINNIVVERSLENGLLRQAIFSAIRTKYLPKTKNGLPVDSTNPIVYTFDIR